MQDLWVGDVGDMGKYGLLRALTWGLAGGQGGKPAGLGDGERQLKLGVIWYWQPDTKDHSMHPQRPHACKQGYRYICTPSALAMRLAACDDDLYQKLRDIVLGRRRYVRDVEHGNILPPDTAFFHEDVSNRSVMRSQWFERGMDKVQDCDLVFLDPDNGLTSNGGNPNFRANQDAFYEEAAKLWGSGKSLVLYQHTTRRGTVPTQITNQATQLRRALGLNGSDGKIIALRFHRFVSRVFFVIPNPEREGVADLLRRRVDSFMESSWGTGGHFTRVDC